MSRFGNILAFLVGVAVGGAAVWSYAREKYAAIAEEEIRSVKETFRARERGQDEALDAGSEKTDISEYDRQLREAGYTDCPVESVSQTLSSHPIVISPDEFEENEEFFKVELLYFADGVLTDEVNEIVENADEIIGDALNHFGEYEEDSVYVQNDTRHCCYAIRKDLRYYSDVLEDMPPVH